MGEHRGGRPATARPRSWSVALAAALLIAVVTVVALRLTASGPAPARVSALTATVTATSAPTATRTPVDTPVTTPVTTPTATPPAIPLVRWHGPVWQIFVHPLVLQPRLAFTSDQLGQGFQNYFVTAREFRGILAGLWRNGWSLVDPHRVAAGDVVVPRGRKPLVLYEDDANYYAYFDGRGLADRLVLDRGGDSVLAPRVLAEVRDARGTHLTTNDVVPLVDAEVARHPAFSADGARGVLAVTGYEGLFGEHDLSKPAARARVRALVQRLRATGWTIASHTYGHINLGVDSLGTIAADTERWKQETRGLVGPVDILVYPFGARPTEAGVALLRDEGYRIQVDIDVVPRVEHLAGAVVMDRLHVDGYAFDVPERMARFFSVAQVRDPLRP